MSRVFLQSLGCRLNQSEIEALARQLAAQGHVIVDEPALADICVVNTCAVTAEAERKTRHLLRALARANPQARIAVLGCAATLRKEELASFPNVAWVLPNEEKERAVEALALTPTPLPPSPSPALQERGRGWPEGPGEEVRVIFLPADPLLWPGGEPAPYALGVEEEWAQMLAVLQEADPSLELVRVVPPTADALDEALAGVYGGIFHFTGHGDWDGRTAYLLFETPSGASDPVESGRVADILRGRVVLAVLSACRSATPGESREANLAALLAAQGTPFVLGMQLTVPDVSARRFTTRFYHYLFRGESVLEAVRRGRLAVLNDTALPRETRALVMGIPVLYVRGPGLPEFRRPEGKGLRVREPAPKVDLSGIPEPEAGFFGRNLDLVKIGEKLVARHGAERSAVITLYGTGGIGKTALLRKAAERFAWAFDGVLALPLEPLPTLADVLGRLERFLGIPEDPKLKPQERQERVAGALKRARVLLALDNFETLTRAGDEGNTDARELQRFLRSLPARGTALLVSSRERTDLPGEQRVEVSGLDEGAGARLFSAHVSARRDALTEEGMRALSRRVGGHPLALKLLARRFDTGTEPLRDFVEGVEAVLPEAADRWDDGRRHDTLRACFDFSLAPLERREPALAEGLARLTIFSGPFTDFLAAPAGSLWSGAGAGGRAGAAGAVPAGRGDTPPSLGAGASGAEGSAAGPAGGGDALSLLRPPGAGALRPGPADSGSPRPDGGGVLPGDAGDGEDMLSGEQRRRCVRRSRPGPAGPPGAARPAPGRPDAARRGGLAPAIPRGLPAPALRRPGEGDAALSGVAGDPGIPGRPAGQSGDAARDGRNPRGAGRPGGGDAALSGVAGDR
ncbi:MAG: CHAT domain-containing protein [Anaerolineae bacterium]|nr:CHAT domain-containing protein [Anaerolineae bacterium]